MFFSLPAILRRYLLCLAVCVAAFLTGCSALSPTSHLSQFEAESTHEVASLPATVVPAITSPLLVPAIDKGIVTGQVLNRINGKPMGDTPVYLAKVFRTADGSGVFALEPSSSPSSVTDAEGRFVIRDVPPGEYVIAIGEVGGVRVPSVVMESPTEVKAFTVQPNVITDLGLLQVDR